MKPCPDFIGGSRVICYTPIDDRHQFTGACRQIVRGELLGSMAGLAICQNPQGGFYLFGCDDEWREVTDTWHLTVEAAQEQGEFEYQGTIGTWIYPEI